MFRSLTITFNMEQKTLVTTSHDVELDLQALKKVADLVTSTLGANGKIIHIYKDGFHRFTKDGITVLNELVSHEDPHISRMAGLIIQAAHTQLVQVGDGTTTATLLTYHIFLKLLEVKDKTNITDRELKEWLTKGVNMACDHIEANKLDCDETRIKKIAATSANNNPKIGDIIGDLVWKVGKYGNIRVERKENSSDITTELKDGYFWESEARLPLNHKPIPMPNGKLELNDCWVMNTNMNFTTIASVEGVFMAYRYLIETEKTKKPLVVICEDLSQEALGAVEATLLQIKDEVNGTFGFAAMPIVFVKAAYFQESRHEFLADINAITGGQLWDNRVNAWSSLPTHIEQGTFKIGTCEKFTFHNEQGAVIHGSDNPEYIEKLQGQYETAKNPQWKEFYGQRLAKLKKNVSSLGIIHIGADVEGEGALRYDVIDDTWKACMSALKRGCVYGGGYALYQAYTKELSAIDKLGFFRDVLLTPFEKLTNNANYPQEGGVYNIITKKWESLAQTNILDPADAPITALVCAANIAFLLATKDFSIIHKPVSA